MFNLSDQRHSLLDTPAPSGVLMAALARFALCGLWRWSKRLNLSWA